MTVGVTVLCIDGERQCLDGLVTDRLQALCPLPCHCSLPLDLLTQTVCILDVSASHTVIFYHRNHREARHCDKQERKTGRKLPHIFPGKVV